MSIHLPGGSTLPVADDVDASSSGTDTEDDEDQTWDDWVSDSDKQPCRSLFDSDKTFPSAEETLKYDKESHGFDLDEFCSKLGLDFHGRIRLINYIRKSGSSPSVVSQLESSNPIFQSDEYLIPVIEDDPLLRVQPGDWSDSEDEDSSDPQKRIKSLEAQLRKTQEDFAQYRKLLSKSVDAAHLVAELSREDDAAGSKPTRDDDTHYFDSYAENDIHAVMINDKVRTSTYADFINSSESLFEDAIVLDVGCGTGILSLFAARAGAKHVFAVDASDIAEKAKKNVAANGLEKTITVIRGKVEDIKLPDGIDKVDVIVSEWMGYALLYESMLDSVLVARDRFLKPEGGVMAPSQCQMMLGLADAGEVWKDRIGFWDDVYGFNMSAMAENLYDDSVVDVLGPHALLSEPAVVKDLLISTITPKQLDFVTPFTLPSTAGRRTKISAFVLYFDTFFTVDGNTIPPNTKVKVVKSEEPMVAEVWPVGGKPNPLRRASTNKGKKIKSGSLVTSFSTGPQSEPTHWKQTIFFLREPFNVTEDSIVKGTFHCKKSETNSRELDVEIHYVVFDSLQESVEKEKEKEVVVQMFKVR